MVDALWGHSYACPKHPNEGTVHVDRILSRTSSPAGYDRQAARQIWLIQEAVVDSLGICTVLEGCRQLTKIAFNQLDMADSVFERMARQTTQLQVWSLVCVVSWPLLVFGYRGSQYDAQQA